MICCRAEGSLRLPKVMCSMSLESATPLHSIQSLQLLLAGYLADCLMRGQKYQLSLEMGLLLFGLLDLYFLELTRLVFIWLFTVGYITLFILLSLSSLGGDLLDLGEWGFTLLERVASMMFYKCGQLVGSSINFDHLIQRFLYIIQKQSSRPFIMVQSNSQDTSRTDFSFSRLSTLRNSQLLVNCLSPRGRSMRFLIWFGSGFQISSQSCCFLSIRIIYLKEMSVRCDLSDQRDLTTASKSPSMSILRRQLIS